MRRTRRVLVMFAVPVLALTACGGDDDETTATTAAQDTTTSSTTSTTIAEGAETTTTAAASGSTVSGCEDLTESPDGVYPVGEAGEVEIARDGETLRLVEARAADGWTATGDLEDDEDEVEVDFTRDDRTIEFDAEIDDGRLEIEVCED